MAATPALEDPTLKKGPASTNSKHPLTIVAAAATVLLLGVGAYVWSRVGLEDTDDAQVNADVIPLAVRAPGLVMHLLVKEDQPVHKGDVIMQLDEADQAARVRQSEAELKRARAQLATALAQVAVVEATATGGLASAKAVVSRSTAGITSADANIRAAKAGLARAEADNHRSEQDLTRTRTLRDQNAATQERLDHVQAAFDESLAALHQAQAQLSSAQVQRNVAASSIVEAQAHLGQSMPVEAQVATAHAAVELAQASIQTAQAQLDQQRLMFSYLRVTAPVDGVLSRLSAHEGQLLALGQAVGEMVPSTKYITANFKETQIGKMRPGQLATIKIDAFGGHTFTGRVESLSGGTGARFSLLPPDNATGNFVKVVQRIPVRIALLEESQTYPLRAGLSCDVTIHVAD